MDRKILGSITAKGGFLNEFDICDKFFNYKQDKEAKTWLTIMGYLPNKIDNLEVIHIPTNISKDRALSLGISPEKYDETIKFKKADIQILIKIIIKDSVYIENISLKKANKSARFNQVDKRPVSTYQKIWRFSDEIAKWLRLFTGDLNPFKVLSTSDFNKIKDKRRVFLNEIPEDKLQNIILFFENNKSLIISDILRGRGGFAADWFLVTKRLDNGSVEWCLKDINTICNFYQQGKVKLTPRGSLKIGRVTMQRKGGTPDPTSLQFKINPLEVFDV